MAEDNGVSFAEALSFLIDKRTREDRKPYSDRDISQALKDAGVEVSYSYIWMLRSGKKTDPRVSVVNGLARFFAVPSGFFLDRLVHDEWVRRIKHSAADGSEVPAQRGRNHQHGPAALLRASLPGMSDQARSLIEALAAHVSDLESEDARRS